MKKLKGISKITLSITFWLWIWFLIALIVNNDLLVPGPQKVFIRFFELFITADFWINIISSIFRVMLGIIISVILGSLLGFLSYKYSFVYSILSPIMTVARATPVASFIILIALFIGAITVPSIITIIMVVPVVWLNIFTGLNNVSKELKEVCLIFNLTNKQKINALYIPATMPYFTSAILSSIGLGWKAGIAAEILFPPLKSIGKAIYEANWLLKTIDLFTWTLVVILLSVTFELITKYLIKLFSKKRGMHSENFKFK